MTSLALTWGSDEGILSTQAGKITYVAQILLQDEDALLESFSDDMGEGEVSSALMHYLTLVDKMRATKCCADQPEGQQARRAQGALPENHLPGCWSSISCARSGAPGAV